MSPAEFDDFIKRAQIVLDLAPEERAKLEGTRADPMWDHLNRRAAASRRGLVSDCALLVVLIGGLLTAMHFLLGWLCGIE